MIEIPQFHAELHTKVVNKFNEVVSEHKFIAQSFVRAMTALINAGHNNPHSGVKYGIKDTGGTFQNISAAEADSMHTDSLAGDTTFGLVVGGEEVPVPPALNNFPPPVKMSDFKLFSQISNADLTASATTITGLSGGTQFTITRSFTNNNVHGRDMNVYEIGLIVRTINPFFFFLIDHQVGDPITGSPIIHTIKFDADPNTPGQQAEKLVANYTIKIT